MRWAVGARTARELTRRNSLTSPYLWLLCLVAVIPAALFWRHTLHLFCFVMVFAVTYVWLYVSIVRCKSPKWLVVGGRTSPAMKLQTRRRGFARLKPS